MFGMHATVLYPAGTVNYGYKWIHYNSNKVAKLLCLFQIQSENFIWKLGLKEDFFPLSKRVWKIAFDVVAYAVEILGTLKGYKVAGFLFVCLFLIKILIFHSGGDNSKNCEPVSLGKLSLHGDWLILNF